MTLRSKPVMDELAITFPTNAETAHKIGYKTGCSLRVEAITDKERHSDEVEVRSLIDSQT